MMDVLINVFIPALLFFLMWVVGLELGVDDFRRVAVYPKAVLIGTASQFILLPLLAAGLILMLAPPPHIAAGMILLAACPGGAISNFYTYLAGANTALSVTLTAVSSVLSILTLPLIASAGFRLLLDDHSMIDVPVAQIIGQLVVLLLLPITLGMLIRIQGPTFAERQGPRLRRLSIGALIALLAFIFYDQAASLPQEIAPVSTLALTFTLLSMAIGFGLTRLLSLTAADGFALLVEFPVRNLAIVVVIAVTTLGRPEYVVFAAVFFMVQVPFVLLAAALFRRRSTKVFAGG